MFERVAGFIGNADGPQGKTPLVPGRLVLGIEFEGGNQWDTAVEGRPADIDEVRDALAGTQAADAKVLVLSGSGLVFYLELDALL